MKAWQQLGLEAIRACPRCTAMSKQAKRRCRQVVVPGFSVCYWHGARGGAPLGNLNGLKHGNRSADAVVERKAAKGMRIGVRALGEIAVKAAKGRLAPGASAVLLHEIQEVVAISDRDRRSAAASKAERLRRKNELAEPGE